jgi:toxin CptA
LLLAGYLLTLGLAVLAVLLAALPWWAQLLACVLALLHAVWCLPRQILLRSPQAFSGLRHDDGGWQLFNRAAGWQPVQLRPSSVALPLAVVVHFRLAGQRRVRGLCIPCDALSHTQHRRLRLQLKFSRHRWAAAK